MKINRLKNSKLEQLALDKEIGSSILYLNHEQYTSVGSLIKSSAAGKQVSVNKTTLDVYCAENKVNSIDLMKIDCEGAEWDALMGIGDAQWGKIKSMVIEVHDEHGRLEQVKQLLNKQGFTRQVVEQEEGLENSKMYNLFALR
jgi:FkbM family methyltransferase